MAAIQGKEGEQLVHPAAFAMDLDDSEDRDNGRQDQTDAEQADQQVAAGKPPPVHGPGHGHGQCHTDQGGKARLQQGEYCHPPDIGIDQQVKGIAASGFGQQADNGTADEGDQEQASDSAGDQGSPGALLISDCRVPREGP